MSGYIGTQPVPQATQTRDSFTATSGQTSFATGGYTPNFLDVYLNGVKLSAADYTASNGSDVVLASGAATGDILEVVAFTTFNSASSSIDDNGNATAITIDSNENVLITKTATGIATVGSELKATGELLATVNNDACAFLNRKSSDGDIINLRKDGSTVGAIQARSSFTTLQIGSTGTGITGTSSHKILPSVNNARSDNTNDLGDSSYRWKDAYLSGGIYLGGVGSANKLDDYEVGIFTPSISGLSFTTVVGTYVKVGKICLIGIELGGSNNSTSGEVYITNLPFTSTTAGYGAQSVPIMEVANISLASGYTNMYGRVNSSDTRLQVLQSTGTAHAAMNAGGGLSSGAILRTSFSYRTAS